MNTHLLFTHIQKNTSSFDLQTFASVEDVVVTSVKVRINPVTGRGQGVGFVTFASVDDAARAAELLAGKQLHGMTPQVRMPTVEEVASFTV